LVIKLQLNLLALCHPAQQMEGIEHAAVMQMASGLHWIASLETAMMRRYGDTFSQEDSYIGW